MTRQGDTSIPTFSSESLICRAVLACWRRVTFAWHERRGCVCVRRAILTSSGWAWGRAGGGRGRAPASRRREGRAAPAAIDRGVYPALYLHYLVEILGAPVHKPMLTHETIKHLGLGKQLGFGGECARAGQSAAVR